MPCAGFERAALRVTVSSGALSDRVNERRVKVKTFFRHALGVFLSVTLTASLFTICAKTVSAAGETEKIKVACVGDSITQGQGTNLNWPDNLQKMLGDGFEVRNFGKGGCRVREYWPHDGNKYNDYWYDSEQYISSTQYDADIVIVMMGTNDGYFNEEGEAKDYFAEDYTMMIRPYLENGSKIYITTPTHAYAETHQRVNGEIHDEVAALQESLKEEYPEQIMDLVDMNRLTDGMPECFPDGLHGNTGGYAAIASIFYEEIFLKAYPRLPELSTVSVKTEPGASVTVGLYIRKADDNGEAVMKMPDGTYTVEILKENFQRVVDSLEVSGDTSAEYKLVPGEINIALGKAASASSFEKYDDVGTNYPAELAFDGDTATRWAVDYKQEGINDGDHPWLMVDLGEKMSFNGVRFYWYECYGTDYEIQVSDDNTQWTTVHRCTDGGGGVDSQVFKQTKARYVRILFNRCSNDAVDKDFVSIYEMQVLQNAGGGEWTEPGDGTVNSEDSQQEVSSAGNDALTESDGNSWAIYVVIGVVAAAVVCAAVIVPMLDKNKKTADSDK